jgi:hypothetical protein
VPPNLLASVCIEKNPTELDDFGGILCNVDAVLVTRGCNVDDHVAIEAIRRFLRLMLLKGLILGRSHFANGVQRRTEKQRERIKKKAAAAGFLKREQ